MLTWEVGGSVGWVAHRGTNFPDDESDAGAAETELSSEMSSCSVVATSTGQGLTVVHLSAQPEPFLTQNTP